MAKKTAAPTPKRRSQAARQASQDRDQTRRSTTPPGHATAPWSGGPTTRGAAIKVRATKLGYYDHKRQREGDVFTISSMDLFSDKWMELVDPKTPERTTTGNQALRQHHDEVMQARRNERDLGRDATGAADVLGDRLDADRKP